MPWTLYRTILLDLLKLLVTSTAVLVIIVSFAAAIRPLQDGLLGPGLLIKFVLYSLPTMLQYVLPLTAAFASTMVFLRMARDREVVACSAAGMSYRKLVFPVVMLALVLTMGLFYLSNYVVPDYYVKAQRTARKDVVTLLMAQLREGQPFAFNNWVIYADQTQEIDVTQITAANRPSRGLLLSGVAIVQLDHEGTPRRDVTAERADVYIYETPDPSLGPERLGDAYVQVLTTNVVRMDERGVPQRAQAFSPPPQRIPARRSNKLEFFTLPELRALADVPERYERVRAVQIELAQIIAVTKLKRYVRDTLAAGGTVTFGLSGGEGEGAVSETFDVPGPPPGAAPDWPQRRGAEPAGPTSGRGRPIRVVQTSAADVRVQGVESLQLVYEPDEYRMEPRVSLEMTGVQILGPDDRVLTERQSLTRSGLRLPFALLDAPAGGPILAIDNLKRLADQSDAAGPAVDRAKQRLSSQLEDLDRRVRAEVHLRVASAVSAGLVLCLGTVMALRAGRQMPLVVYLWTFLLAIGTVMLINTGHKLIVGGETNFELGVAVLWLGNLAMAVVAGLQYYRVTRN